MSRNRTAPSFSNTPVTRIDRLIYFFPYFTFTKFHVIIFVFNTLFQNFFSKCVLFVSFLPTLRTNFEDGQSGNIELIYINILMLFPSDTKHFYFIDDNHILVTDPLSFVSEVTLG